MIKAHEINCTPLKFDTNQIGRRAQFVGNEVFSYYIYIVKIKLFRMKNIFILTKYVNKLHGKIP